MPSGPVTTWTPAYLEAAQEYVASFMYDADGQEPQYHKQVLPSACGLAVAIKIARSTLYSWANNEETGFAGILGQINTLQESFLINNGLTGSYNATIAKLVLGKHGYKDESAHTGADNQPLIPAQNSDLEAVRRIAFAFAKARSLEDAADKE